MDFLRAICAEHGVFLRVEAFKLGIDDKTLGHMRRAGSIVRVRHGAYTYADLWDQLDMRGRHLLSFRAAARCSKRPVAGSHVSAVLEHVPSYWGLDLSVPHLTRLDGKGSGRTSGYRQHRGRVVHGDTVPAGAFLVTSPARAAIEVTTVASVEAALVSVNAILHAGLCNAAEIRNRYEQSMSYWPNTLATNVVLHLMDHRIESVGESRTLHLLWKGSLPRPELQYEVYDTTGVLLGRVDFAWPELGVYLEFDGKLKYQKLLRDGQDPGDVVFQEKKREDRIRRATGWRCIRITWADLEHPERTIAIIRAELAAARPA